MRARLTPQSVPEAQVSTEKKLQNHAKQTWILVTTTVSTQAGKHARTPKERPDLYTQCSERRLFVLRVGATVPPQSKDIAGAREPDSY